MHFEGTHSVFREGLGHNFKQDDRGNIDRRANDYGFLSLRVISDRKVVTTTSVVGDI